MTEYEELSSLDLETLDDESLLELLSYVQKKADNECWKEGIKYNIKDTELVRRLETKLGYISLACVIAYLCKTNYDDVFENICLWDVIISSYLLKQNIVIPVKNEVVKSDGYEGAFVKDPIKGKYDWVVSFDLTSLYPSIIRSFNISPDVDMTDLKGMKAETFLTNLRGMNANTVINNPELIRKITPILVENNLSMCANGTLYSRDNKSFLASLMELFFNERKKAKKQMLSYEKEYQELEKEMIRRGIKY